jgi:hypothetical protein
LLFFYQHPKNSTTSYHFNHGDCPENRQTVDNSHKTVSYEIRHEQVNGKNHILLCRMKCKIVSYEIRPCLASD